MAPAHADAGARAARAWLDTLSRRAGADGSRVDHVVAIARALDAVGRTRDAESALERLPRNTLAPRDASRISLALALLAIERNDVARARELTARALGRAPGDGPEVLTARALWALLDALDGDARRTASGLDRIAHRVTSPLDRALVALARAHRLVASGEVAHARTVLRALDGDALVRAERLAASCPGPASQLVHALERPVETPYR